MVIFYNQSSFLGRKIYRVKAKIPVAAAKLIEAMKDTEKLTEWNTTLTKYETLKVSSQGL